MASFEDYDEFGNYIGADLDSDDEEVAPQNQFVPQPEPTPLEGYDDDDPMQGTDENALMQIDGACSITSQVVLPSRTESFVQNLHIMLLSYMRISSIILQPQMSMGRMWRPWFRRRMLSLCLSPS